MPSARKPPLRQVLAANIRNERNDRNWSQEELGNRAGLSQTYVSQVESGSRKATVDTLERLAAAFAIDESELVRRTPKQ